MGIEPGVVALTCGDARWDAPGAEVVAVPPRPGRAELAPVVGSLGGRRLIVCGTDADLAAVVLRLLRDEQLDVTVGYLPAAASAMARLWRLPASPTAVVAAPARPVPVLRDDAGGVLLGLGVLAPVRGVAYCDDVPVLRGDARRVEVTPDAERGLRVRVVSRRWFFGRSRVTTGRAVQFSLAPTEVLRDGVPARTPDRWTWYRHTEDLRLAGARP